MELLFPEENIVSCKITCSVTKYNDEHVMALRVLNLHLRR